MQPVVAPRAAVERRTGLVTGVDQEVRPVVGEHRRPDAEHPGRDPRRADGAGREQDRARAEHVLPPQEHRIQVRRVPVVLRVAPAGRLVGGPPVPALRRSVQQVSVDGPFHERLDRHGADRDRRVGPPEVTAHGPCDAECPDGAEQHRRPWVRQEAAQRAGQGADLGRAAVRPGRVDPPQELAVARVERGPRLLARRGPAPGRAPGRVEEDGPGGAQPPRDRSRAVQQEAVDHDVDFTCPAGVWQPAWPGTPHNTRYVAPDDAARRCPGPPSPARRAARRQPARC